MPPLPVSISHHFRAKEIRDILKSKAHCLRAGFQDDHTIIKTLNDIRDSYIRLVGLPTYLSEMLGPIATAPIRACRLYRANGQPIKYHLNGNQHQPLQKFIQQNFPPSDLPFRIEVHSKQKNEVRFL